MSFQSSDDMHHILSQPDTDAHARAEEEAEQALREENAYERALKVRRAKCMTLHILPYLHPDDIKTEVRRGRINECCGCMRCSITS